MDLQVTNPLPGIDERDLAPGDFRSLHFDWTGFNACFVRSVSDPRFQTGFAALTEEFGPRNEMESRDVILQRFDWRPEEPLHRHAMLYAMVVVTRGNELAAVADQTAIVPLDDVAAPAVAHLSHLLVSPRFRGSGLSGWMRALPLRTVRECLSRSGQADRPIALVAEVEPADPALPERAFALHSFERVGFRKIDDRVNYLQPDFRERAAIDAAGRALPVPLSLLVRRVGQEGESTISGRELRSIVSSLYTMYGQSFRPGDMLLNWQSLENYPPADATVDLVPPSKF